MKTDFPALDQWANGEIKTAVLHQTDGFRFADQLKHRTTDHHQVQTGGMVDGHQLREYPVDGQHIFLLLDQVKDGPGGLLIIFEEFQEDGEPIRTAE